MTVVPEFICRKYKGRARPYVIARAKEYWAAKRKAAAKRKKK
jgi:hypothetical protein